MSINFIYLKVMRNKVVFDQSFIRSNLPFRSNSFNIQTLVALLQILDKVSSLLI